ncbi:MAG: outer membrane protein transport protein [Pseudomonadota bacterium]
MRPVFRTCLSLLAAFCLTAWPSPAMPAGFAIKNQSGLAQANAFAGATAGAESIGYMFFNPAGLTRHHGHLTEIGTAYLVPRVRFEDGSASTVLASPIAGASAQGDVADDALVPSVYVMASLGETWRAALGINAPFGQKTTYDPDWIGRYHARRSELSTVNINPTFAWRPGPSLSVGAGLQVQHIETELSNAIDFGTIGAAAGVPGAVPTAQDGEASVEGDDWAIGYNLGILWSPKPATRFGIAYRSRLEHSLRGRARFTRDQAGIADALAASTGRFVDSNSSAEATLPATLSVGAYHDIDAHWAIMGEIAWTSWSDFDELRISFDNPNEPDNVTELAFNDTIFAAVGVAWTPNDAWSVRGGFAFDQGATRDRFRTPRLPGGDRYWLSAGVSYTPAAWLQLGVSATRIFVEDSDIALTTDGPGNQFRGNISGTVEADIDTIAFAAALQF